MSLVVVNGGMVNVMTTLKNDWNSATLKLGLFQNNVNPTRTSTLAGFTEADFAGYARLTLDDFAGPTNIGGNVWQLSHPVQVWSSTGPTPANTIYGYLVADSSWTTLLWAEKFTSPVAISASGSAVLVGPRVTGQSLFG